MVAMADDGGLAAEHRPSSAMAHLGKDGYSILVTYRSYMVQVRVRGGVGDLVHVHGRAAAHGAWQCSCCFG